MAGLFNARSEKEKHTGARLGEIIAELTQGRHIGQHGEAFRRERRQRNEIPPPDVAHDVRRMADQRVGIPYQAVDGPAHGAVRLLHKLHIQLGKILDKVRHADLEGTGGVGDPDPGLAGMGLRVGLERPTARKSLGEADGPTMLGFRTIGPIAAKYTV